MLLISLNEGDYVMIGDSVKVTYDHLNGKNSLVLGIEAPKNIDILRGEYYERELLKLADEGNADARVIFEKLSKERTSRRRKSSIRRAKQKKQAEGI